MAVEGVSNISLFTSTISDVNDVEKNLADLQQQISSGLKSQNFAGLGAQVAQYTQVNAKISASQQYQNSNNLGISRLQTADTAMQQMESIANDIQSLIMGANNASSTDAPTFALQLQNDLKALSDQLNTSFDGQYIFGGTNTATPPVTDPTYNPVSTGTPDAGYYGGSSSNLTYQADANITYQFPVRADNIAFQQIFAAASQAINAFTNKDSAGVASALTLMQQGNSNLVDARSQLNSALVNVQSVNTQLNTMQLYWQGVNQDVANTDLVAASTKVSNYQAILQATFQVYSTLSQLRLSDYLK